MKNKNNNKGFTLIELLIYMAIVSIMLLGIVGFSRAMIISQTRNLVISEVESQGMQVLQIISQTIRNGESIIAPNIGTGANSLTVNVVTSSADPAIFSLSNDIIYIKEGSGGLVNLTSSRVIASDLLFQNLSLPNTPGIVKFSFVLSYNNQSAQGEYNFAKTFYGSAALR